jgi:DNA-binding response OmpR family regulator
MNGTCMKAGCAGTMTIAVVDPRPEDYAAISHAGHRPELIWHFLDTGREALRLAHSETVDLWVVNFVLPDMPGSELCGMLRSRSPAPAVYMVTDAYRAEDERAAWACGAALFVCKPVQAIWFDIPDSNKGAKQCSIDLV